MKTIELPKHIECEIKFKEGTASALEKFIYNHEPFHDRKWREDLLSLLNEEEGKSEKLNKFKKYVHERLDKMKIPKDPEPEKNKEHGCRIEGRLNFLQERLTVLKDAFDDSIASSLLSKSSKKI